MIDRILSWKINRQLTKTTSRAYSILSGEIHKFVTLLYPHGMWVREPLADIETRHQITKKYAEFCNVIYHSVACDYSDLYATADILQKDGDAWNIIEAFETRYPSQEEINAMAFKKYVFEFVGYKIKKSIIVCLRDYFSYKNLDLIFEEFDMTEQVNSVYRKFFASIRKEKIKKETLYPQIKSLDEAYVDYSSFLPQSLWENNDNMANHLLLLKQSECRVVVKNRFHIFRLHPGFFSYVSKYEAQIRFLLSATNDVKKVFIHNKDFEKVHLQEMAKNFPKYAISIIELTEKLREWQNYCPIPFPTIPYGGY